MKNLFLKSCLVATTVFCSVLSTLAQTNILSTIAGNGGDLVFESGGGGIDHPYGVTFDCSGNVYISQQEISTILRRDNTGIYHYSGTFTSVAEHWPSTGSGPWPGWPTGLPPLLPGDDCTGTGFSGDGSPADPGAAYGLPSGMIYDPVYDRLYIADPKNNSIRFVQSPMGSAILNTFYPLGGGTLDINHPAAEDPTYGVTEPGGGQVTVGTGLAVDGAGNLYIADNGNNRVIMVPPSYTGGAPTVIAGTGVAGYSGDGGPATAAKLQRPTGVAVDNDGNVYIADYLNNVVREVDAITGNISTFAGNGTMGFSGDGLGATSAELAHPISVAVDDNGRVYIADLRNNRIRAVINFAICTVAGDGTTCDATTSGNCPYIAMPGAPGWNYLQPLGDGGDAALGKLWFPSDVKVDKWGNLFIVDMDHNKIRHVCKPHTSCDRSTPSPSVTITDLGNVQPCLPDVFTAKTKFAGCTPTYQWYVNGVAVAGATGPVWSYVPGDGDVITCVVVPQPYPFTFTGCSMPTDPVTSNQIIIRLQNAPCICAVTTPLSGVIAASPTPGNYIVTGPITIPTGSSVSFTGCVMQMTPGVTITVQSGAMLTIDQSHLFCCAPDMWQGIILNTAGGAGSTGQLEILNNSLIEDAKVAVDIPSPVAMPGYSPGVAGTTLLTLFTHGATFNKNGTGIRISNYAVAMPPVGGAPVDLHPCYPFVVENTVFTSRTLNHYFSAATATHWPLVWPATTGTVADGAFKATITPATNYDPPYNIDIAYAQTLCNDNTQPKYGIDLESVGITLGSLGTAQYCGVLEGGAYPTGDDDLNIFDNLNYGVYAMNSNFVARNSSFMHMHGTSAGDGIYSYRSTSAAMANRLYKLDVFGITPDYINQFWDCSNCVEAADLYDVIGTGAVMCSKHSSFKTSDPQGAYGYKITSSQYYDVQINGNTIYNIANGISHTVLSPIGPVQLVGQVTIDNNTISNVNPMGGTPTMNEYVRQGIYVRNLSTSVPDPNYLTNSEENIDNNQVSGAYNGIYLIGCNIPNQTATTDGNTISIVQDLTSSLPVQSGISHINTINDYIYNNNVSGPGYNVPAPPSASGYPYTTWHVIEGIHVENTMKQWTECNSVKDACTGFYFGSPNHTLYWHGNTMESNSYGYVLNGFIGTQPQAPAKTTGNQWLPAGFWTGTNYQTYVVSGASAMSSTMEVTPGGAEDPTNNGFDGTGVPYSPGSGSIIYASLPPAPCVPPPATGIPAEYRQNNAAENNAANTATSSYVLQPNPNTGSFTVTGNSVGDNKIHLEVFDLMGRSVFAETFAAGNGQFRRNVTLADLANGMYILKISDSQNGTQVIRFTLRN